VNLFHVHDENLIRIAQQKSQEWRDDDAARRMARNSAR
jgi:hypothetical protein